MKARFLGIVALLFLGGSAASAGTPQTAISVPGMAQYTDVSFGFSFWYPATWTVKEEIYDNASSPYSGGSVVKSLAVSPPETERLDPIHLREFVSSDKDVIDSSQRAPSEEAPYSIRYFFDEEQHLWMAETKMEPADKWSLPKAADISDNTMGGLHLFSGTARFGADTIIPLSAKEFVIADNANAGDDQARLAATIVALDPAVADPVSKDEQVDTIRAEGVLFGVIGKRSGVFYTDERNVYDSRGHIILGSKASGFRSIIGYYDADVNYATDGLRVYQEVWRRHPKINQVLEGANPKTFKALQHNFAKDKSHVWYLGKPIDGADPKTFVVTESAPDGPRPEGAVTVAHDGHHTYAVDAHDNVVVGK
jgi:hypothetical protein